MPSPSTPRALSFLCYYSTCHFTFCLPARAEPTSPLLTHLLWLPIALRTNFQPFCHRAHFPFISSLHPRPRIRSSVLSSKSSLARGLLWVPQCPASPPQMYRLWVPSTGWELVGLLGLTFLWVYSFALPGPGTQEDPGDRSHHVRPGKSRFQPWLGHCGSLASPLSSLSLNFFNSKPRAEVVKENMKSPPHLCVWESLTWLSFLVLPCTLLGGAENLRHGHVTHFAQ